VTTLDPVTVKQAESHASAVGELNTELRDWTEADSRRSGDFADFCSASIRDTNTDTQRN